MPAIQVCSLTWSTMTTTASCRMGALKVMQHWGPGLCVTTLISACPLIVIPVQISVSACTSNEKTWEDTEEGGGMTTVRVFACLKAMDPMFIT